MRNKVVVHVGFDSDLASLLFLLRIFANRCLIWVIDRRSGESQEKIVISRSIFLGILIIHRQPIETVRFSTVDGLIRGISQPTSLALEDRIIVVASHRYRRTVAPFSSFW